MPYEIGSPDAKRRGIKNIVSHRDDRFKLGKTTKPKVDEEPMKEDVETGDGQEGEASASASGSSSAARLATPTIPRPSPGSPTPTGSLRVTQPIPGPTVASRLIRQPPNAEQE